MPLIRSMAPELSNRCLYPRAVTAKPPGTGTPLTVRLRYISPRLAFLPPTSGTSSMPISSNQRTKASFFSTGILLEVRWGSVIFPYSCHRRNFSATRLGD